MEIFVKISNGWQDSEHASELPLRQNQIPNGVLLCQVEKVEIRKSIKRTHYTN